MRAPPRRPASQTQSACDGDDDDDGDDVICSNFFVDFPCPHLKTHTQRHTHTRLTTSQSLGGESSRRSGRNSLSLNVTLLPPFPSCHIVQKASEQRATIIRLFCSTSDYFALFFALFLFAKTASAVRTPHHPHYLSVRCSGPIEFETKTTYTLIRLDLKIASRRAIDLDGFAC